MKLLKLVIMILIVQLFLSGCEKPVEDELSNQQQLEQKEIEEMIEQVKPTPSKSAVTPVKAPKK